MTFLEFKEKIRRLIFASTEPENLVDSHNNMVQEGLAFIQQWIEDERDDNVNVIPFCQTNFKCGTTIVPCPRGKVKRVYTIANDIWCNPVTYRQVGEREPECWSRNLLRYTTPDNSSLPVLPMGFTQANVSTDSKCGRALTGIWAIVHRNIQIAPWIQSNEKIVIEWEGQKTEWADSDIITDDINFFSMVKLFVAFAHERDYGSVRQRMLDAKQLFADALADRIAQWKEWKRLEKEEQCVDERYRSAAEIEASKVPDVVPATDVILACIGGYASGTADETAVAALVASWTPNFVIANSGAQPPYATYVGADYGKYVNAAIADNAFWPVPGAQDWDSNNLGDWQTYFAFLPGNQRYYEMCLGNVHFFFMDTDAREPDGVAATGPQAQWLRAKLLLSTARFKIVVMDRSPFSGGIAGSQPVLQWPFEQWGADAVISGGDNDYERLQSGNVIFLNNGLGGGTQDAFSTTPPQSVKQYNELFGAIKATVSGNTLTFSFYSTDGVQQDTITITK